MKTELRERGNREGPRK